MAKLFKNLTVRQKLILWLQSKGWVITTCKSSKYVAMYRPGSPVTTTILLGASGGFRISSDGTVGKSRGSKPAADFTTWCQVQEESANE